MNILNIIVKKRDGEELTKFEIDFLINGICNSEFNDYQIGSILMAIHINGLTTNEISDFALSIAKTGQMIDLISVKGVKIDNYSMDNMSDSKTLVLSVLVASLGLPIIKIYDDGIGVVSKLKSINGFNISISNDELIKYLNTSKIAFIESKKLLAPIENKLSKIRKDIGVFESLPLMAASIMSKKIALGIDVIVFDIKIGNNSQVRSIEDARELAKIMVDIGKRVEKKVICVITSNTAIIGNHIGNTVEVIEAIEVLKGNINGELLEFISQVGAYMLILSERVETFEDGIAMIKNQINNGEGLKKLKELIKQQGGNDKVINDYSFFKSCNNAYEIKALSSGYVYSINCKMLKDSANNLIGENRGYIDETDYGAGIILKKKIGDRVLKGDVLAVMYATNEEKFIKSEQLFYNSYVISDIEPVKEALIFEIIN